ncbi:hypothetical protein BTHE68_40020 [Burkholderia sp. THE68]|nr:hypothetical protein BTHE68_40020 [Burkholderia sp. THE68]
MSILHRGAWAVANGVRTSTVLQLKRCAIAPFALVLLGACGATPTVMQSAEKNLQVDGPNEQKFHSVLYFPKGEALHYPGDIVALEKSPQSIIGGPSVNLSGAAGFLHADAQYVIDEPPRGLSGRTEDRIKHFQKSDSKAMFVSHIVRYRVYAPSNDSAYQMVDQCFVYNAFTAKGVVENAADGRLTRLTGWLRCTDKSKGGNGTNVAETSENSLASAASFQARSIDTLYGDGLAALKPLENQLTQDVQRDGYTHLLVVVMGWNTSQDEAIRNFNDIVGNIVEAAYPPDISLSDERKKDIRRPGKPLPFRPLVIGVTWPSFWSNRLSNFLSYKNKAGDADELGLSWLNVLLNRTLPCVLKSTARPDGQIQLRTVLIGHSFGARAATRALFSSPMLETGTTSLGPPKSPIDLAIGLQGAVSINRFVPTRSDEGAPYRDFSRMVDTTVVLTASEHDAATSRPFWYDASGSIASFRTACNGESADYGQRFSC